MPPSSPPAEPGPRRALLSQLPRIYRSDGTAIQVLVVDDERALTDLVSLALGYEGWIVEVAHDGSSALAMLRQRSYDLIVLDIMLPDSDGLEILRSLRSVRDPVPVLLLTALDSVQDRVVGLTEGGDDYMVKPFSLEELVARLRGLLRRSATLQSGISESLSVGDLYMNQSSHEVTRSKDPISLSATEFELLRYFMQNPRIVLSRKQILDNVWNYDFSGKTSIVDLYVSYLRKKVDSGRDPVIHTVRGVGYILRPAGKNI